MKTKPINYFQSKEDLKVLTQQCTYISVSIADIAITQRGNMFIKFKYGCKNIEKEVEKLLIYLLKEGWEIKRRCSIFLY